MFIYFVSSILEMEKRREGKIISSRLKQEDNTLMLGLGNQTELEAQVKLLNTLQPKMFHNFTAALEPYL